jgi:hypothetical protein
MKAIICIAAVMLLGGCSAMKEASESITVEIDWLGILEATRALF